LAVDVAAHGGRAFRHNRVSKVREGAAIPLIATKKAAMNGAQLLKVQGNFCG
jgi:hypothetical protein